MKTGYSIAYGVLVAILACVVLALGAAINGWALSILWAWFIVPVFGLPALSIAQAVGISVVVALLTSRSSSDKSDDDGKEAILRMFLQPLVVVGFGWVVTLFL